MLIIVKTSKKLKKYSAKLKKYSRKLNVELLETKTDKYDEYLFIDMEAGAFVCERVFVRVCVRVTILTCVLYRIGFAERGGGGNMG